MHCSICSTSCILNIFYCWLRFSLNCSRFCCCFSLCSICAHIILILFYCLKRNGSETDRGTKGQWGTCNLLFSSERHTVLFGPLLCSCINERLPLSFGSAAVKSSRTYDSKVHNAKYLTKFLLSYHFSFTQLAQLLQKLLSV